MTLFIFFNLVSYFALCWAAWIVVEDYVLESARRDIDKIFKTPVIL